MCSWNIAGARDKLNNDQNEAKKFVDKFDVIWILETKHIKSTEISGFIPYHNPSTHGQHRGGILLLVKNYLRKYIQNVNMDFEGQIWLELSLYPNISFGGVYIPPVDSRFFDQSLMANMNAHIEKKRKVVILGDFNARPGRPIIPNKNGGHYEYPNIKDDTENIPGKNLVNLCKEKSLVIANHLKHNGKHFGGNLSYRKGRNWISEIDLFLIHEDSLPILNRVEIRQETTGSDHAPLCVTLGATNFNFLYPLLLDRAKYLGQSYIRPAVNKTLLPKTRSFKETDMERFKIYMQSHHPPAVPELDIETALKTRFETVNKAAYTPAQQEDGDTNEHEILHLR